MKTCIKIQLSLDNKSTQFYNLYNNELIISAQNF